MNRDVRNYLDFEGAESFIDHGNRQSRGLSRDEINSIRSVRISNANVEEFLDQTCTICLNECKKKEKVKVLSCKHVFHDK